MLSKNLYSVIQRNTKIYNPKTHNELYALLTDLEDNILILLKELNHTQVLIDDDPNLFVSEEIEDNAEKVEKVVSELNEIAVDEVTVTEIIKSEVAKEEKLEKIEKIEAAEEIQSEKPKSEGSHKNYGINETNIDPTFSILPTEEKVKNPTHKIEDSLEIMSEDLIIEDSGNNTDNVDNEDNNMQQVSASLEVEVEVEELKNDLNNEANFIDQDDSIVTMQEEIHQQLKEQDLKQIELEKKLTQQELNTLKDRKELTKGAIEQLTQYKSLKLQELDLIKQQYQNSETLKTKEQAIIEKEIVTLEENQIEKK